MYKHLFGPIPSRRLSISLGIDLVPKKVCSLDCVYCEVGKTTNLTTDRLPYVKASDVIEELEDFFKKNPDPDFLTFSGYGEPLLNSEIGQIVRYVKKSKPNISLALLTNSMALIDRSVWPELMDIDVILPSMDAVTQPVFEKINRPHSSLSVDEYIDAIIDFRKQFKNKMWLEILILPGYNDAMEELLAFKDRIVAIGADSVQLNTLDRPGTVGDIRPATRAELQSIIDLWQFDSVEIISSSVNRKDQRAYQVNVSDAVLNTVSRRPCTLDDLSTVLGIHYNVINKYLEILVEEGKIVASRGERGLFYQTSDGNC